MEKENQTVYFNTRDELTKVCLDDVMYVVSDGNYISLSFKSGRSVTLLASLNNFVQVTEYMDDKRFVRIDRSHIVNVAFVSQLNCLRRTITLVDDQMKMMVELMVTKEAVGKLKQMLSESQRKDIPCFHTANGKMNAFQMIES